MTLKVRFTKVLVFLLCLLPIVWLVVAALTDALSANPIKDITEHTGTWALRFLLITLCVTPLRKFTGWNEVIRYRRMLGLFAFFYGFLHSLTYAWLDQFFSIPDIVQDVYKRPFITAGFSAFVVMIPLAITSTKKWIARLGGRRWQLLHRLTYLGAIAGVVHYLWLVKADTQRPLIYGFLLTILLGFRALHSLRSGRVLSIRSASTTSVRHLSFLLFGVLLLASSLLAQNTFDVGIKVGQRIPSFKLSDQNGSVRDFTSVKGPKGVVLLFFRSADWCPYCKSQLVQLERSRDRFVKKGLGVVAISYDSRQILQNFSNRMKIGFPLLSDEGSAVIRAFGILNTSVIPGALDDGVPYPGIFVVDPSGKVTAKYFEEKYQERFTPDTILSKEFGLAGGVRLEQRTDHLKLTTQLSQDKVRPGNRVSLVIEIEMPAKVHIYAPGVKGYRPVTLLIESSSGIAVHEMKYPKARTMNLKAIKERVPIYEGRIRIERDFTVSPSIKIEKLELKGTLEYQACDDRMCYAPTRVPLILPLEVEQLERQRVPEDLRRRPPEE